MRYYVCVCVYAESLYHTCDDQRTNGREHETAEILAPLAVPEGVLGAGEGRWLQVC